MSSLAGRRGAVRIGVALTAAAALLHLWRPSPLVIAENRLYDLALAAVHSERTSGVPVIVDIDEASLREFGQWPWPRYRMARLLEAILDSGASGVGVDLLFPEPDRTSLPRLKQELKRDLDLDLGLPDAAAERLDNDRVLASALVGRPFVMGFKFLFEPGRGPAGADCLAKPIPLSMLRVEGGPEEPSLFRAVDQVCNIAPLSQAADAAGFLNAAPDSDGVLRRVPALMESGGGVYPSLALAAVMQSEQAHQATLKLGSAGGDLLRFGNRAFALGGRGTLLIHFRGGGHDFPYISAADVLAGRVVAQSLRGKIVFLGSSAAGLEDLRATPLSPTFPGVEIHATVADNILMGDTLRRPAWAPLLELFAVLAVGVTASFLLSRLSAGVGWFAAVAVIALLALAGAALLKTAHIFVSPFFPVLTLVAVFFSSNMFRVREKEREALRRGRELAQMQKAAIRSLAALAETRDPDSSRHILRTQKYVRLLADRLRNHPRFRDFLERVSAEALSEMVALHDIGKVGVPDRILLKPGKLSEGEFETMKRHTSLGREALRASELDLGDGNAFLEPARNLVYSHHEKWDGSGYPEGLKGEEIPVEGRIMAVADVYDALISRRVYKPPFTHETAVEIMKEGRGRHFDPAILDAFLEAERDFHQIAQNHPD